MSDNTEEKGKSKREVPDDTGDKKPEHSNSLDHELASEVSTTEHDPPPIWAGTQLCKTAVVAAGLKGEAAVTSVGVDSGKLASTMLPCSGKLDEDKSREDSKDKE